MYKMSLLYGILFIVVLTLVGCGKMSAPQIYEGSGYPHSYPQK